MKDVSDILSFGYDELCAQIKQLGEPEFRTRQIFSWLHQKHVISFDEMTNISKELLGKLKERYYIVSAEVKEKQISHDGTVKYLLSFADGECVETVAMRYHHGMSVCLSTQAGCSMGCTFCASAEGGKLRDLSASEILAQVYRVEAEENGCADSVVLMGIGEPLDNFDNVTRFCDIVTDARGYNLAGRAITLSTCGIVPRIYELADQKKQLTLSISLHAASNKKRSEIMPVNNKYPLEKLIPASRYYFDKTGRRVTFEYAVIHEENDSDTDAAALAKLLSGIGAHVNIIPVNLARGNKFSATRQHAEAFAKKLAAFSINATVRRTLGDDIAAACGQLRRRHI